MNIDSYASRRWFAPEVIQTSSMDCGPAVLKCLLEGFGLSASYSHLREACQTSVDGTSIDVMESVVQRLGLVAEQVTLPVDYLWEADAKAFPSVVVTTDNSGITHFVVLWRKVGQWIQIMDPSCGRKWLRIKELEKQLFVFSAEVECDDWLEWANSEEAINVQTSRLQGLGASKTVAKRLVGDSGKRLFWRNLAINDAAVRMLYCLREAGGLRRWNEIEPVLELLKSQGLNQSADVYKHIPERFWSATATANTRNSVKINGAVLIRVSGVRDSAELLSNQCCTPDQPLEAELEPELASALGAKPLAPLQEFWRLIRAEGLITPLTLALVIGLSMSAVVLEALLFRGLFDLAGYFSITSQRLFAFAGFMAFILLLWVFEFSIVRETLRAGRHLEARIRVLLMSTIPKLKDRYMQSRQVSDVAERCHSVFVLRALPELSVTFMSSFWQLVFTITAIGLIAPASLPWAILIGAVTITTMFLAKPVMSERELRVRSQLGALQKFYFDALLGAVPIRTHSAERSIRREHESLLVEWARSARRTLSLSVAIQGIRGLLTWSISATLLYLHITKYGVTGDLLLLVYWTLKLPALGEQLVSTLLEYPTQRSVAMRLLEVISSTQDPNSEEPAKGASTPLPTAVGSKARGVRRSSACSIQMNDVQVVVAGHEVLKNINIAVSPGEHIAVVGPSGAGKSSLLGLLLGFHEAEANSVFIDGQPLSGEFLESLRPRIAWVDPAVQIWNHSLLENLRFSPASGSHSELGAILEKTDLTEVVAQLPEGFQATLGEGGARLSGGEGQRVRLARAMWQSNIGMALLDEPFRGLDKTTRQKHLAMIKRHWRNATLLCVTHDIEETSHFDRVLVLENGRITEDGVPQDLIDQPDSRYRELLDTERQLHQSLWSQASLWRRLTLDSGKIREAGCTR